MRSIAIITANHQREQILELYCLGIERLRLQCPNIYIHSVIVGDKQDITDKYMCEHITYKNSPLSEKFNIACKRAKELSVDAVIIMGSDDLMNKPLFDAITARVEGFVAINDIYLYSLDKACTNELRYIRTSNSVGCARMLSTALLHRVRWQICNRERDWGIDQVVMRTIAPHIESQHIFTARDIGGMCVDIKTEQSMNKFTKWKGLEKHDPQIMFDWLSQEEKDLINKIINQ